ncbi:hypothetical protein [Nonomuraea sp. NPDC050691]|uniref:hypothetical protein n=1 Tax=Nonomuraea sp. NPDC050691 TaxID=3155661 RepID=UPI0033E4892A
MVIFVVFMPRMRVMNRQSVQAAVLLSCVTIVIGCWWLKETSLGLHIVNNPEQHLLPWLELLGIATVWYVLSGRLEQHSRRPGTGLSVTARVGALVGASLAAGVYIDAEYDWWFGISDQDKVADDIQTSLESIARAGVIRFILVYFAIVAITLGFATTARGRAREEPPAVRRWRDVVTCLAVLCFCALLAFVYSDPNAYPPTTPLLHWPYLVIMVLALGFAALAEVGRSRPVSDAATPYPAVPRQAALRIDIAIIAASALIVTSFEGDTFAPGVFAWIVLAVGAIGIMLCSASRG